MSQPRGMVGWGGREGFEKVSKGSRCTFFNCFSTKYIVHTRKKSYPSVRRPAIPVMMNDTQQIEMIRRYEKKYKKFNNFRAIKGEASAILQEELWRLLWRD